MTETRAPKTQQWTLECSPFYTEKKPDSRLLTPDMSPEERCRAILTGLSYQAKEEATMIAFILTNITNTSLFVLLENDHEIANWGSFVINAIARNKDHHRGLFLFKLIHNHLRWRHHSLAQRLVDAATERLGEFPYEGLNLLAVHSGLFTGKSYIPNLKIDYYLKCIHSNQDTVAAIGFHLIESGYRLPEREGVACLIHLIKQDKMTLQTLMAMPELALYQHGLLKTLC